MAITTQKDKGYGVEAATQAARDAGTAVLDSAKDLASTAAKKVGETAGFVGHKADDATMAVGSGIKSLAGTIRDKGPHEGMLGNATSAVASTLESGGRYLEHQGLSGVGDDFTNLIRRNPIPAVLIGIGVGFLIARASRR